MVIASDGSYEKKWTDFEKKLEEKTQV